MDWVLDETWLTVSQKILADGSTSSFFLICLKFSIMVFLKIKCHPVLNYFQWLFILLRIKRSNPLFTLQGFEHSSPERHPSRSTPRLPSPCFTYQGFSSRSISGRLALWLRLDPPYPPPVKQSHSTMDSAISALQWQQVHLHLVEGFIDMQLPIGSWGGFALCLTCKKVLEYWSVNGME